MAYERLGFHGLHRLVLLLLVLNFLCVSKGRILEPEMSSYDLAPPKGTLKTIKGEDGEVVDCVDVRKQPAFGHPLLKDHKIQFAVVRAIPTTGMRFYGGSARISVWDPFVARHNDSSASTLVVRLSSDVFLEAGWIVYPKQYGDDRPRLFIYFTTDNSFASRCWDLDCNGFVQVNNTFSFGGYIPRVSTIGGVLYGYKISIFQDRKTGNWWVSIMDTPIGYWPASLFPSLPEGAMRLQWGGSVYDSVGNGPHTDTNMGNGLFPDVGTNKASYVCSLQYVDKLFKLQTPERSSLNAGGTNPLCYNAQLLPELDPKQGMCFLFGGPGNNPKCP